jgi:hypothetical protein
MIGKDRPISPSFLRTIYLKGSQGAPQDRWAGFRSIGALFLGISDSAFLSFVQPTQSLLLAAFLLDDAALGRVLEIVAGRNKRAPAIRVATCVQEPSGFFLKASQDTSAKPAGYELIV